METSQDRRLEERIAFRVPAHITVGDDGQLIRGYVLNMSDWGVFVMMDQPASLQGEIRLGFEPAPGASCAATGVCAHQVEMGNALGFGIQLTERNAGYAHFIRNLEAASDVQLMKLIRDMKRIDVRVA